MGQPLLPPIAIAVGALVFFFAPAAAQDARKPHAEDGKKPSEILTGVEQREDFLRLIEMSWNDRGYYEIEYRTTDKAKVEINIDAKSGMPVDQE